MAANHCNYNIYPCISLIGLFSFALGMPPEERTPHPCTSSMYDTSCWLHDLAFLFLVLSLPLLFLLLFSFLSLAFLFFSGSLFLSLSLLSSRPFPGTTGSRSFKRAVLFAHYSTLFPGPHTKAGSSRGGKQVLVGGDVLRRIVIIATQFRQSVSDRL